MDSHLTTLKQRVARIAVEFGLRGYTPDMLRYVYIYEELDEDTRRALLKLIRRAEQGRLINFTSLHRVLTEVRQDFQGPEDRIAGQERRRAYSQRYAIPEQVKWREEWE